MRKGFNVTRFVLIAIVAGLLCAASIAIGATGVTTVLDGTYTELYNCVYPTAADVDCTITHGLGAVPDEITAVAYNGACYAATESTISNSAIWVNGVPTSTSVKVTRAFSTNSGGCVIRVKVQKFHSLIK